MTRMQERMAKEAACAVSVSVPEHLWESSDFFPPGFRHQEIEALYQHGFDLPESEIKNILALPRATLIEDLEAVLRDCLDRGSLYLEDQIDYEDEETLFAIHAIFLLGELKAHDSLPAVLEVLSQHPDVLEFWFGDLLEEDLWEPLYHLVDARMDEGLEWMISPGIPASSRLALAEAVAQIALHDPNRRDEALDWLRQILEFLLHSPPEDNILDTHLVTILVWFLMDLRAEDFLPLIRDHFEKGYVKETFVGDLQQITESISEPLDGKSTKDLRSVPDRYRKFTKTVSSHVTDSAPSVSSSSLDVLGLDDGNFPDILPFNSDKIGRNDPCPCGSGKKYKKCCLK